MHTVPPYFHVIPTSDTTLNSEVAFDRPHMTASASEINSPRRTTTNKASDKLRPSWGQPLPGRCHLSCDVTYLVWSCDEWSNLRTMAAALWGSLSSADRNPGLSL
ncbi:hypothetical protein ISCGN_004493 [Ixodes scapularis]